MPTRFRSAASPKTAGRKIPEVGEIIASEFLEIEKRNARFVSKPLENKKTRRHKK